MKKIIYLSRQVKSITGGHKYNDEFVAHLEKLSELKVQSTPSCSSLYRGWKRVLSPIAELKRLRTFDKDTLVVFGDSFYKYHFLLAVFNKCLAKAKSTMIIHHFPFIGQIGMGAKVNRWLMCKYVSMMDSIVVPSPFTLNMAKDLFPGKKIFYVPIPFERILKKSQNYEIGNLLYVGTIEERKGLSYLIEAISLLENKQSVKLNIVGKIVEPAYYDKLQQQITTLGLFDNVKFFGRVSNETLAECYQKAEIFTFPSLLEGYGIVLIEAFNNGLPIICFNNTAMPYTVIDGINGLIAKNKDAKDLASKIQQLIGNTSLREKLQKGIEDTVMNLKTEGDFECGFRRFWYGIQNSLDV